jgi:hypothetical protein
VRRDLEGEDPLPLVEAGLRTACAQVGTVEDLAAFELFEIPREHPFLRSMALPKADPPDWQAPLEELVRAAAARALVPRIELLVERRLGLRTALVRAGWLRTLSVPVLVIRPTAESRTRGSALRLGRETPEDLLVATLVAQHAISGASPPSPAECASLRGCLSEGGVRTWVRLDEAGRPIAAVSLLGGPPAVELAGLWTAPERRREGLGRDLARTALADAAETGVELVWAGAASRASEALLQDLGMLVAGTLESWERPAAWP